MLLFDEKVKSSQVKSRQVKSIFDESPRVCDSEIWSALENVMMTEEKIAIRELANKHDWG